MKASIFEIYVKVYFYVGSRNRTLLPSGLVGKESACNAGDPDWVPGSRRSPEGESGNPLLPGEFHGQRSLAGNSPWGHKELDTTGQLTHFSPISEPPPRSVSQPKLPSLLPQVTTISTFWVFPYSFIILICIHEHRSLALYRKMTCL